MFSKRKSWNKKYDIYTQSIIPSAQLRRENLVYYVVTKLHLRVLCFLTYYQFFSNYYILIMHINKHHAWLWAGAVTLWIGAYFIPQFFHEPVNFTTQTVASRKNPISEQEVRTRISDDDRCESVCQDIHAPALSSKICNCCGNGICEKQRNEDKKWSPLYCEKDCRLAP